MTLLLALVVLMAWGWARRRPPPAADRVSERWLCDHVYREGKEWIP